MKDISPFRCCSSSVADLVLATEHSASGGSTVVNNVTRLPGPSSPDAVAVKQLHGRSRRASWTCRGMVVSMDAATTRTILWGAFVFLGGTTFCPPLLPRSQGLVFFCSRPVFPSHRERRAHNAPSLPLPPFRDSGAAKRGSWLQTLLFCCHIYASRRSGYHIAQLGRGRGCCAVGRIRRQSLARADICIPRISCNRN